jgi:hypothetical protein
MTDRVVQRFWPALAMVAALAGFAGCAAAPVQEMSNARQAIRAARDAGAEKWAPDQIRAAQDLLSSAEQNLQKRMYRDARRAAVDARTKASEAMETAQAQTKSQGNG